MKDRHQKEFNQFPIGFAFSNEQFKEQMKKLGLTENDTDKVVAINGGGFIRKSDIPKWNEMCIRIDKELEDAIQGDKTGTGFIYDMFLYELENHEYIITGSVDETIDCLGFTMEEVKNNTPLMKGLSLAKKTILEKEESLDCGGRFA